MLAGKQRHIEPRPPLLPGHQALLQIGKLPRVARRIDDKIDPLPSAVLEHDGTAVKGADVRLRGQIAVGEVMQEHRIHYWMGLQHFVIRPLEPEAREIPIEQVQKSAKQKLREPKRKMPTLLRELIERLAENMLRDEVIAPPQTDEGGPRGECRVTGDVAA